MIANAVAPATNLSNHHSKSNGVVRTDSLASASMNRSLSTPDLIAALMRFPNDEHVRTMVKPEDEPYCTNLDTELLSSQHNSSLNSSSADNNDASISLERTNSRSSRNELTVPNGSINHHNPIESQLQTSNGSLVSFSNVQLMHAEEELIDADRRISLNSMQSDAKRNLLSLQTVGRTLQRTHNHLKRTRLLHLFYFLALPIYTILGALIFQQLDGAHDDLMMKLFNERCIQDRAERLMRMETICNASGSGCFRHFKQMLTDLDTCYRDWQKNNHTISHPMSELTNAIVYAFSVYTSIGYGTVSASTFSARLFTVFYAALGIPLFFDPLWVASDQRRVFVASVVLFILYLLLASYIYSCMTEWNYFTSFYFTFSSVALIGFGDVYPQNANIVLANTVFIVIGVILFSMCYFVLQEEIRVKAFEASRKARMSISKYSHSLMLHASKTPWSRRNSPAFDQHDANSSNNSSKRFFERNRKRRQSAPAIHVQKMDDI